VRFPRAFSACVFRVDPFSAFSVAFSVDPFSVPRIGTDAASTLPLEGYAGIYKGEGGSLVELQMHAGGLVLQYGNFVADVTDWHDDTFRARLRQRRLAEEQDWYLSFTFVKGALARLHIHSEHDVHADFVPSTTSRSPT
jgi:hypothetical protein